MKYYICELISAIGEYEHETTLRFETDGDPLEYAENLARTFWGIPDEEDDGTFYYSSGEIACWANFANEISKEVYDALNGSVTQMVYNP